MRTLILPLLIAAIFFVSPSSANASCLDYGTMAVEQQKENIANGCGFIGLRWHNNQAGHEGFCRLVGEDQASNETTFRSAKINECQPELELEQEEITNDQINAGDATQCMRSDPVKGTDISRGRAREKARDQLGKIRAELINSGLTKCIYHDLGCTGVAGNQTCWLSVGCCAK